MEERTKGKNDKRGKGGNEGKIRARIKDEKKPRRQR